MCNFLNFSYGSQFEKRHKMANKAHDHAGNMAHWLGLGLNPRACF